MQLTINLFTQLLVDVCRLLRSCGGEWTADVFQSLGLSPFKENLYNNHEVWSNGQRH